MSRSVISLYDDRVMVAYDDASGVRTWSLINPKDPAPSRILELLQVVSTDPATLPFGYYPDRTLAIAYWTAQELGGRVVKEVSTIDDTQDPPGAVY